MSEGEPSAAEVPDGLLAEASPAGRWTARGRRGEAVEALERFEPARDGGARGRVSPEVSLRSRRPGERCSTLRTHPRRREALRPFRSALGGESGARSYAALRVWDGPSGFLWRESREKPDSDSDYGFIRPDLEASDRVCSRRCGIVAADAWQSGLRRRAAVRVAPGEPPCLHTQPS